MVRVLLSSRPATYAGFWFFFALGKGFVCDEEDFLEAATGVLRSIMEKLVSLQEPQVSTSFTNESFLKQIVPRQ